MHSAANNLAAEKFAAEKTGKRAGMSGARCPLCLRRRAAGDKIIVTYAVRRRILSERTDMKNEVLEELFKKYYNEAKLYVASLCRDSALADEIVSSSFYKAFTKLDEAGNKNFMLDGFPRNINQARMLDAIVDIDKVIDISVDFDILTDRITGRRNCPECGYTAHVSVLGEAQTCPKCGGEMQQRMDDREETVKERLKVYNEQTAPLIEYYKERGKLCTVNGMGTPEDVFEEVRKVLG